MLIINADDYGGSVDATDNILVCYKHRRITSASAMVFMADSERATELSLENNIDVGLHLNFTLRFSGDVKSRTLMEYQTAIAEFLLKNKYSPVLYNPFLRKQFAYVYHAQYEEFVRLFRKAPTHINGHHHMHLCMNLLVDKPFPNRIPVRRNFTFFKGEKNSINRLYRYTVDRFLTRRYVCTDFFFSISPLDRSDRFRRIVELSQSHNVEFMVHPQKQDEYDYLMSDEYLEITRGAKFGTYRAI